MTREQFLAGVANWSNHRYLLWDALKLTSGEVVEMGCGDGSTPFLRDFCKETGRMLYSYENNLEWWGKMSKFADDGHKVIHVQDWDVVSQAHVHPSVVLIDHAPGERRKVDLRLFAHKASIIVCHDSEPAADHGYQMREILDTFRYKRDHKSEGAWASIASNFLEV